MRAHDRRAVLFALAGTVIGTGQALAQNLRVEVSVDGGAYTLFANVPTFGGTADITIFNPFNGGEVTYKIYDDGAGAPNDSLGKLTISGSVGTPEIRILFARGVLSEPVAYPVSTGDQLDEGLLHLGTPGQPVIVYASTALRDRTRVAAAVTGDVRGDLTAGRITRVQALGLTEGTTLTGGTISGAITSTQADEATNWIEPNGALAIGHVVAAREISGDVTALTPPAFNPGVSIYEHTGSIDTVLVGPFAADNATGLSLTADLKAQAGKIQSVQTAGPILARADRGRRPQFVAGNGVWSVTTVPTSTQLPRDLDFSVDIQTNAIAGARFADAPVIDSRKPTIEQTLRKLETAGDLTGNIIAENISAPQYIAANSAIGWWGVEIGGTFTGRIRVEDRVLSASIRAGTFVFVDDPANPGQAMVDIGTSLKGSIVATGTDGVIPSVRVGLTPLNNLDGDTRRGFIAAYNPPAEPPLIDDPTNVQWSVFQEPDAMIRASAIGSIALSGANKGSDKRFAPRIESPSIGALNLGESTCLIVWSGRLDQPTNDYGNDYAAVGSVQMQCTGTGVDLWLASSDIKASGNFAGRLHMNTLGPSGKVSLGGVFNETEDQTCVPVFETGDGHAEGSPRNGQLSQSAYGQAFLLIAQSNGLSGQVIVGTSRVNTWSASNSLGACIGASNPADPGGAELLWRSSPQPRQAPHYLKRASTKGGGAIGEVPFALHIVDSVPESLPYPGRYVAAFDLTSTPGNPIRLSHYGPITFAPMGAPVTMERESPQG